MSCSHLYAKIKLLDIKDIGEYNQNKNNMCTKNLEKTINNCWLKNYKAILAQMICNYQNILSIELFQMKIFIAFLSQEMMIK